MRREEKEKGKRKVDGGESAEERKGGGRIRKRETGRRGRGASRKEAEGEAEDTGEAAEGRQASGVLACLRPSASPVLLELWRYLSPSLAKGSS